MKVGLIGCGYIANGHMTVYKSMNNVDVIAVSDIDLKKASFFARKYGVSKVYENYFDLLERKDLDIVDVCTPVSTHARIVCDAAKFGHNVLVEKPMALSTSECERMIHDTEKQGTKLCVCHNRLFLPSIMQVKSMVDSGHYNLTSFKTTVKESFELLSAYGLARSWNLTPKEKGIIWEVGCHEAYLQLHFLGNVEQVYALGNKVKYPVYDDFTVLLGTSGPRYGVMEVSWVTKEQEIVYEISTSDEKRIQINEEFDQILEKSENPPWSIKDVIHNIYVDEKRFFNKWLKFGLDYLRKRKIVSHFNLICSYIENLEKDLPPPVTPQDGRNTVRLLECIEESLDKRRVVTMT